MCGKGQAIAIGEHDGLPRSGIARCYRAGNLPASLTSSRPKRISPRPDGRTTAGGAGCVAGGKSGLHGNAVPANGRRGRPQGKCHRKQTARAGSPPRARVKGCGKSAPRPRRRGWQGKPHREQDRIGATGGPGLAQARSGAAEAFPPRRPGWSREARSNARPRGMAVPLRKRWTEPGLQAVWQFSTEETL